MRMHRSHPDDNFTILPNEALQDERLSLAARGLLVSLISRPADWQTNADTLSRQAKQRRGARVGEGRRGMRAAFAELEKYGYLVRTTTKGERGLFVTGMDLYDTPGHGVVEGTAPGTSEMGTSARGTSVTGTSLQSTDQQRNDQQSTDDKHSSSLADARAAAASASARSRERELNEFYGAVDRLDDKTLRNALTTFENKRPRIYRQCRRQTAIQYNDKDPRILKSEDRGRRADELSYKWALKHYSEADEWPMWLIRPLPKPVRLKSVS